MSHCFCCSSCWLQPCGLGTWAARMRALAMWTRPSATRMSGPMEVAHKHGWCVACPISFNTRLGWNWPMLHSRGEGMRRAARAKHALKGSRIRLTPGRRSGRRSGRNSHDSGTPIRHSGTQAYSGKLLVLPWNQSWDYSFESLPMLTTLKDGQVRGAVG